MRIACVNTISISLQQALGRDWIFIKLLFSSALDSKGSNEAIKQSIAGGMGVGVVSRHALSSDPASEGLYLPEVEGFPIETSWRIVFLKGKRLSPIARAFRDHLLIEARALSPSAPP